MCVKCWSLDPLACLARPIPAALLTLLSMLAEPDVHRLLSRPLSTDRAWNPRINGVKRTQGTGAAAGYFGVINLLGPRSPLQRPADRFWREHFTYVELEYAFFHCAKAYLRSQKWRTETWPAEVVPVQFGRYFTKVAAVAAAIDQRVEAHYEGVRKAVAGEQPEPV